jgi:hypothetical protein
VTLAYNLCVLLQREPGKADKHELQILRMRLSLHGAVWRRTHGQPTLRLAVPPHLRRWWIAIIDKLRSPLPPFNRYCKAVETLRA